MDDEGGSAGRPEWCQRKEFLKWLKSQWVTVAIAVLGATGAVYITRFQNSDSFAPSERWGLWVATFTAVTSASLLLNALGAAVEPSTDEKPKVAVQPKANEQH